jgi:glutathione gamma-glutamylcysteinyltransferase
METTLYSRPLPEDAIAFSSAAGRQLFAEALAAGGLVGYFPLAEQFHTQSDPAFCGLGSLVVALNALGIDPGRLWKGPWRWFAEDLLDCCVPLSEVRERGLDLDQLGCLARCNGADVELMRADQHGLELWRAAVSDAAEGRAVLIASYDRKLLGQSGGGHFSPVGGYHAARDLVLVLDVARFKYPPHWVPAEKLWRAMQSLDPVTGKARGWMLLRPRALGIALGYSLRCDGGTWAELSERLIAAAAGLRAADDLAELCRAIVPLTAHVELRTPTAAAHREALVTARNAIRSTELFPRVLEIVGDERAEAVTILLLAMADRMPTPSRALVDAWTSSLVEHELVSAELNNVRAQLAALFDNSAS